jgi:outer membrane murein-binding lipoprotein Lpp
MRVMRSSSRLSSVLLVAKILVAISAVLAWIAVGGLSNATERALQRLESGLVTARDLADTTASSASELESVVDVVAFGLSNTSGAIEATEKVSANVRKVLGFIDFIGSVDDLKKSLEEAEATLGNVRQSLSTSGQTLIDAGPALHETVVALQNVPEQIDAAIADAAAARERLDGQVWLWRLAVATGALAVIGGLWGVRQNALRVDRLLAAVSTPAG